jgi:hypothetical protein
MKEREKETHPTYGTVTLSRVTSGRPANLFGSSIKHHNLIALEISRASKSRDLSHDFIYPEEPMIRVEMSYTQFAEFVAGAGIAHGTPCTIVRVGGESMGDCPEIDQRAIFENEFKEQADKVASQCDHLVERSAEILEEKRLKVSDKDELRGLINSLVHQVRSGLPFLHSSYNESIEKTLTEAKGAIEAFTRDKITQAGLKASEHNPIELLDSSCTQESS